MLLQKQSNNLHRTPRYALEKLHATLRQDELGMLPVFRLSTMISTTLEIGRCFDSISVMHLLPICSAILSMGRLNVAAGLQLTPKLNYATDKTLT